MSSPTLLDLLQRTTPFLAERGIANARREAEWIFAETLGLSRLELYTRYDMPVGDEELATLRARVARRGRREPLAYVLGSAEFHGLTLTVSSAVLVPRPETEELVELVLADAGVAAPARVLDLGTGSGAIALALAQARPQWQVHGADCSREALAVARLNGERTGAAVHWQESDGFADVDGHWDLVVANLPYVGEGERELCDPELAHEPALALFAGADGMQVLAPVIAGLDAVLAEGGVAWFEHGFRQAAAVAACVSAAGLQCTHHRDGAGHERFTRVVRDG